MKTDNELIADFMDIAHPKEHYGRHRFNICGGFVPASSLKYHESWDWLMPVVDKISQHVYEVETEERIGGTTVITHTAYPRTFGMLSEEGKPMVRLNRSPLYTADTLIEATYKAVVDWIKTYNIPTT